MTALDEVKIGGLGASRRRVEDNRFIRGKGNYTDDIVLPASVLRLCRNAKGGVVLQANAPFRLDCCTAACHYPPGREPPELPPQGVTTGSIRELYFGAVAGNVFAGQCARRAVDR